MTTALHAAPLAGPASRVTFPRTVRSEWIKVRSLRSSFVLVGTSIAAMTAVGMLGAGGIVLAAADGQPVTDESVYSMPVAGLSFGQLLLAALAVLLVSSEYGTGMIRSTLTAAPGRVQVLLAKAGVAGGIGAVVGSAGAFATYFAIQPILGQEDLEFALDSPDRWLSLAATGLYLAFVAVLALAVGTLLRHSAGSIVSVIGLLFVLPTALSMIPGDVAANVLTYLPSEAGAQLMATTVAPGDLTQLQGGLVLAAWALIPFVAAVVMLQSRDV